MTNGFWEAEREIGGQRKKRNSFEGKSRRETKACGSVGSGRLQSFSGLYKAQAWLHDSIMRRLPCPLRVPPTVIWLSAASSLWSSRVNLKHWPDFTKWNFKSSVLQNVPVWKEHGEGRHRERTGQSRQSILVKTLLLHSRNNPKTTKQDKLGQIKHREKSWNKQL